MLLKVVATTKRPLIFYFRWRMEAMQKLSLPYVSCI